MMHAATSKVENSAQGSSCKLKFVHGLIQTSQTGGQWYSDTSPFSIPSYDTTLVRYDNSRIGRILQMLFNTDVIAPILMQ